jgi:hypothetical protein
MVTFAFIFGGLLGKMMSDSIKETPEQHVYRMYDIYGGQEYTQGYFVGNITHTYYPDCEFPGSMFEQLSDEDAALYMRGLI